MQLRIESVWREVNVESLNTVSHYTVEFSCQDLIGQAMTRGKKNLVRGANIRTAVSMLHARRRPCIHPPQKIQTQTLSKT